MASACLGREHCFNSRGRKAAPDGLFLLSSPFSARVTFACSQLQGLRNVHSAGIVHGDLKPQNILEDVARHELYIADFGLSQLVAESDTATGTEGTYCSHAISSWFRVELLAGFMAPELYFGGCSSPASDMWSAGVILCMLLDNVLPFPADFAKRLGRGYVSETLWQEMLQQQIECVYHRLPPLLLLFTMY